MTRRYPITRHHELRPFFRWSALRQRRRPLVAGPTETLVYQIDRDYLTDPIDAARATSVTAVDTRRDVILGSGYVLPAANSPLDFAVTVFFRCTVVDPVAVVRARHTEAVRDIERFLAREGSWVERLARAHPPDDEHGLRHALTAELDRRSSQAGSGPGMEVVMSGVNVLPATILDIDA